MPHLETREYRDLVRNLEIRKNQADSNEPEEMRVEGYATTFEPYVLYRGEKPIYEQIHKSAFDNAKMDDVIFLYNHDGRVCARMRNNSLILRVDDKGLFVAADLSKTGYAREIYEDIKSGNINQMSWAFFVSEDGEMIDYESRTIHINSIDEVIDVSAVSIPANNQTSINARRKCFEDHEKEVRDAQLEEKKRKEIARKKLSLRIKLGGK